MIKATKSGIDIDITREVLKSLGYSVQVEFASLHRCKKLVLEGKADVFIPTFFEKDTDELFYSNGFIQYKPTIFSLKSFPIEHMTQFYQNKIMSFQGATGYFGQHYEEAVSEAQYREYHDMSIMPTMLTNGRIDAVVLDYYIFYYYLNVKQPSFDRSLILAKPLLEAVTAHAGFNSKAIRDEFDKALEKFLANGAEQKIIQQYIGLN